MEQLSNDREHHNLTNADQQTDILSEDTLRQLSKSLASIVPRNRTNNDVPDLRHLRALHQDLLRTANSTRLSPAHGSASLNALCGFIEQCSSSSIPELRNISFTPTAWIKAFDIFLERSERHKAKPMRRLLLTITNILSKHSQNDAKRSLTEHAVSRAIGAICAHQDIASIKPAIQALEHLIHKGVITAWEIVDFAIEQSNNTPAIKDFAASSLADKEAETTAISDARWIKSVEKFTSDVLQWAQYPDCAPAAGRFLPTFFTSLSADHDNTGMLALKERELPLWISPVKEALDGRPVLLEAFEHHILPGLLLLSPGDTGAFLSTLRLDDINRGGVGSSTIADLQLSILVAKVAADLKPNKITGDILKTNKNTVEVPSPVIASAGDDRHITRQGDGVLIDSENLGINLLEHASSSVRMAALSLLVSSSAFIKPMSRRVIHHLQMCLPHFHVEANAKPRNEFIALMKKLCMRLRGATMSLLRATHAPEAPGLEEDSKSTANSGSDSVEHQSGIGEDLRAHTAFRRWYLLFLIHELRPTASYQSHITALRILHPLLEGEVAGRRTLSKSDVKYFKALDENVPHGLVLGPVFDLLLDPFDDVRHWAALVYEVHFQLNLVQPFPSTMGEVEVEDEAHKARQDRQCYTAKGMIHTVLLRAESKAEITGRADHADGVGRLYSLLYGSSRVLEKPISWHHSNLLIVDRLISKLEEEVKIAKGDLLQAFSNASLHGHLIALRHIASRPDYFVTLIASTKTGLETWREFTERIHLVCHGVWEAVRDTLCFDAPEGLGLDEEEADDNDLGTKDGLSFCWRALKESSSLLHAIVTNKGYGPVSSDGEALKYDDYYKIGSLSFTQLAELRHRGAFSTVSNTFASCCLSCAGSSDPGIVSLVKAYYYDALACMQQNASALTRRSAGMPAMITGILAAYPGSEFFNDGLLDLQAIADTPIEDLGPEDARLPQVHALNCLKDIFTDARFGPSTEAHIADTLEIAASCLESHVWAIRNCGLMLFKALLRRLNGGTDTASTKVPSSHRRSSDLTYKTYPNLPGLVLKLLYSGRSLAIRSADLDGGEAHPATHAHKIFPALEIVERSGLPAQYRSEISAAIWHHVESPDWSIREKAAKALSYVLGGRNLIKEAERLLSTHWSSQNALHGRLLCLRFLLAQTDIPLLTYETVLPLINARWEDIIVRNPCPITAATYFGILADLCIFLLQNRSLVAQSVFDQHQLLNQMPFFQAERLSRNPALALQSCGLKRCLSLKACIKRVQRPLDELSQHDVDAILALDKARQNKSDESCLAILRLVPPHDLRHESEITQYADKSSAEPPKSDHGADFELAIRGYDLGVSYRESRDEVSQRHLSAWVRMLAVAGSEHSELRTRVAAAHSLRGFFDGMRDANLRPRSAPQLLGVYLALCDILVDDDEDVRDHGARTVSSLLSTIEPDHLSSTTTSLSMSPPAAKCRLLRFLEERYWKSAAMFVEVVRRLAGIDSMYRVKAHGLGDNVEDQAKDIASQLCPVAELFLEARTTQIAVFVEEKQNLYIDTVREADEWATLVVQINPGAWDPNLTKALESWTIDALTYFLETYENSHDSGALSPTSKPEVYTLFMRVILSARVLMTQSSQSSSNGKAKENTCRALLEKLFDLGKQCQLHDLLLDRIHFILDDVLHPTHVAQTFTLMAKHR